MDGLSISPSKLQPAIKEYCEHIYPTNWPYNIMLKANIDLSVITGPSAVDGQIYTSLKYWLGCLCDVAMTLETEPAIIDLNRYIDLSDWVYRSNDLLDRFIKRYPGKDIRRMSWEERVELGTLKGEDIGDFDISAFRVKGKIQLSMKMSALY